VCDELVLIKGALPKEKVDIETLQRRGQKPEKAAQHEN
jgi:hypothetical protein